MYRIRNEASSPLVLSLSPVLQSQAAVRSLFFFAIYYSHTATFLSRSSYLSLKGLIRFSVPMTLAELIDSRREQHLAELNEFLRIPSVSAKSEHKPDIERAAGWVAGNLRSAGFESIEIVPTALHPLVYAESLNAPGKPTVLFYGHYDVQPAEPLHLWTTPAFEPTVRNGNIYARGTADDKGQVHIHLKALQSLHEIAGKFPINVKILIEGEEEVGSVSLWNFVQKNKEKLKADALVVSDTSMLAKGVPSITYGLRGLNYYQIELTGPVRDLHSGVYGGAVPNPRPASVPAPWHPEVQSAHAWSNLDRVLKEAVPMGTASLRFCTRKIANNESRWRVRSE